MAKIQREKTAILSVSLPKELRKSIIEYAKRKDVPVSAWVKETLKGAMFLEEWEALRKVFGPAYKKLGIKSDEDVEKYFG